MSKYSAFMSMGQAAASGEHDSALMSASKILAKPVAAGAIAYLVASFMGQAGGEIPFFGFDMTVASTIAVAVAGGNLLAQSISETVIDRVNEYRPLGDFEKSLANPAITATGALALLYMGDGVVLSTSGMLNIAGVAVIAEVGADYAYRNFISNWF